MYRYRMNFGFAALVGLGLLVAVAPAYADIEYSSGIVTMQGDVSRAPHGPHSIGLLNGQIFSEPFSRGPVGGGNYGLDVSYRLPGQPGASAWNRFFVSVTNPPAGTVSGQVVNWNGFTPSGAPSRIVSEAGQSEPATPLFYTGPTTTDTVTDVTVRYTFDEGAIVDGSGIDTVANPEPGTLALFGLGLIGLGLYARRRRNTK